MTDNDDDVKRAPSRRPPAGPRRDDRGGERPSRPRVARDGEDRPRFQKDGDRPPRRDGDRDARPRFGRPDGDRPRFQKDGDRPPRRDGDRDARPRFGRPDGERPRFQKDGDRPPRRDGDRDARPRFGRPDGERPRFQKDGDRPPRRDGDRDARPRFGRPDGERPRFQKDGDRPPRRDGDRDARPRFGRPDGERPRFQKDGDRPPRRDGDRDARPRFGRPDGERPRFGRDGDDRPRFRNDGDRPPPREFAPHDQAEEAADGDRIAKVMARAGLCSRRDAEEWINDGRVSVNGTVLDSPALVVRPGDTVLVDGQPLPERERTRLWLYHKPKGLVTTEHDPEGRPTVFDNLPGGLPRVLSIGRLDINTEGLLLLTNDGGLARVIAHPDTAWLRRYRVRVHGEIDQAQLDTLQEGITLEDFELGEVSYGPIVAKLERSRGSNAWLTMDLREGKNREIKRVLEHFGLQVTRLIRVSFGPFQLGELEEGEVEEIRSRHLREQLGERLAEEAGVDFDSPLRQIETRSPRTSPQDREGRSRTAFSEEPLPQRQRYDRTKPGEKRSAALLGERPDLTVTREKVADRKGRNVKVERIATRPDLEADHPRNRFTPAALSDPDHRIQRGPRRTRDDSGDRPPRRDGDGEARSFRPRPPRRDGDGEARSFKPRAPRRDGDGEARSFKPRAPRRDGDGEARSFKPRPPRHEGDGEARSFKPRPPRREGDGEARSFKPRPPRREGDGEARSFKPRPPRREGDGEARSFKPRPPRREGDGEARSFKPRPPRREGDGEARSFKPRAPRRDGAGDRPGGDRPPRRPGGGKGADRRG